MQIAFNAASARRNEMEKENVNVLRSAETGRPLDTAVVRIVQNPLERLDYLGTTSEHPAGEKHQKHYGMEDDVKGKRVISNKSAGANDCGS